MRLFAFLIRQLSTLLNSFIPFIVIRYFSQVLNFTSVQLNRFAKQAKRVSTSAGMAREILTTTQVMLSSHFRNTF